MKKQNRRSYLGILLIFIGFIFFLDNLNLLDFDISRYFFSWQAILIYIGIAIIATRGKIGTGILLILIGLISLLGKIFHLSLQNLINEYWPVLLILFGIYLIVKSSNSRGLFYKKKENTASLNDEASSDTIDVLNIFGSRRTTITSQQFKGGNVNIFIGSSIIDFKNAKLAEGKQVLNFLGVFSGAKILVPPDMKVISKVNVIFGGFDDKRIINPKLGNEGQKGELIISGLFLFGGAEINNLY
ncbi:hypothetical protein BMS3Abin04_00167 [bacterium BMS3Abin04]|nr:hypothetical protein BMS3Abin04_00167 [bacterium BMS3Abin04]